MRKGWLIMMALVLAGCGKSGENAPEPAASANKVLQAAVCPTSPPNCFQQEKAYVGIDVEIFNAFCESRGNAFDMTAYDWAGMLGAVIAGRADVAFSGISITEKRQEVMDFSDPYMVNTLVIAALADRGVAMATTADWKTYKLGFVRGMYFGDLIKNKYSEAYAYGDLKQYPSYNELLADLGNGNVDGAFMDSLVMADQKEKGIYPLVTTFTLEEADQFGFAFPKGSPLRDEFNQFLREHPEEVQSIIVRYLK
jgi:polar amino acid transport system substrate-binding protein